MWELKKPTSVKLILGILAADQYCLSTAIQTLTARFGRIDFTSDTWPFDQTSYYNEEIGENILRQFPEQAEYILHKE